MTAPMGNITMFDAAHYSARDVAAGKVTRGGEGQQRVVLLAAHGMGGGGRVLALRPLPPCASPLLPFSAALPNHQAGGGVTCARATARSGVGHCLSSLGRGWDSVGASTTYLIAADARCRNWPGRCIQKHD